MITIYLDGFLFNTYSQSDTAMWANSTSVKPWLVILHEPLPRRCSIIHLRQRPLQIILTGRSVTLVLRNEPPNLLQHLQQIGRETLAPCSITGLAKLDLFPRHLLPTLDHLCGCIEGCGSREAFTVVLVWIQESRHDELAGIPDVYQGASPAPCHGEDQLTVVVLESCQPTGDGNKVVDMSYWLRFEHVRKHLHIHGGHEESALDGQSADVRFHFGFVIVLLVRFLDQLLFPSCCTDEQDKTSRICTYVLNI